MRSHSLFNIINLITNNSSKIVPALKPTEQKHVFTGTLKAICLRANKKETLGIIRNISKKKTSRQCKVNHVLIKF